MIKRTDEDTKNKVTEIKVTKDYKIFKRLEGNRDVTNKRVSIIKESINSVGYISNPIICNEKMEIIDGQGRLEAFIQLGMPVEYRVIKGLGIVECRAMNLKPTGWKLDDYVKSYAECGDENYVRFMKLHEETGFGFALCYSVLNATPANRGGLLQKIKLGDFRFTEDEYEDALKTLKYCQEFRDIQKTIGGRKDAFYSLIGWVSKLDNIDLDRFRISMHQQHHKILPVARTEDTLRQFSDVYNYGYPKKSRRMFEYEWKVGNIE